jgi:type VI secretion system protein VasD
MDRERAVLADEGSRLEEIVVRPGEKRTVTLMPKPGVHYIGTVVLFQDIDRARWRAIAPIAAAGLTRLSLAIAGNGARLEAT